MELAVGENYEKGWSDTRPKKSQAKKQPSESEVVGHRSELGFFTKTGLVERKKKKNSE